MSVLSELAILAEQRTDEYANACNSNAEAEAAYLRRYFTAIAESDSSLSNAARERFAEAEAVEERVDWVHAQAAERRCKQAVTTVLARLSAAQSYYRFHRDQT